MNNRIFAFVLITMGFVLQDSKAQEIESIGQEYLYEEAYNTLNEMLLDSAKYSFKKAVLTVENTYYQGTLDTTYYNANIKTLAHLASSFLKTNKLKDYSYKDREMVEKSAAIYKIMKDTIKVNLGDEQANWIPFTYDFEDIWGDKKWSSMFVTKLLKTHKGNCHSLPYLYKIIAEEMDVEAHLALAPNHIYIKQNNEKLGWYNTELTSGYFPIDAWIMASGFVHLDGIKNGLYMKALNDKESIALTLIDLAQGYEKQMPYNDGSFILKCVETALKYYPNYSNALLLKLETTKRRLEVIAESKNKQINEILGEPEVIPIWQDLTYQVRYINDLGYRQMPKEMYLDWLVSLKEEKEKYQNKSISNINKSK